MRIHHRHRARIIAAWGGLCALCNLRPVKQDDIEIHHVVAQADGGSDEDNNLIPLGTDCHNFLRKGIVIIDRNKMLQQVKEKLDKCRLIR